jgi:antitoxin (DNA-binding transcriptional repressor) of toxin-antitoxin stability system
MSSVTVKTLRHAFPKVLAALQTDDRVTITRRGRAVATLTAVKQRKGRWTPPDFTARAQADFGDRFTALSLIDELQKSGGR